MAEKEGIKERFTAGQTVKCMLSEFFKNFILDEYNIYFKKTEDGEWVVYGVCYTMYPNDEEWEYEECTFYTKLAPKIGNVVFYTIFTQTETRLYSSDFNKYFDVNKNGYYFFPLDSYETTTDGNKIKCRFYSYVEIYFDIEDCEIELKRIPDSEYDDIDPEYASGDNISDSD